MRRGGHGYHLQVPWRQHDDPILSSTLFEQLEGRKFGLVIALVGFSTAILIFVWNSRQVVSKSDLPPRTLQGLVFPLYSHNYIQSSNGSQDEMWHQGNGAISRRRRTLSHPIFELRERLYIEMKLGIQAKLFNFYIDTGSRDTWVYCKRPGRKSNITNLGPHGYIKPRNMEPIKCNGKDKILCHKHQYHHGRDRPCNARYNFECLAWIEYEDRSTYKGTYYWESFTLPTWDKTEVKGQGVLGCITQDAYEMRIDGNIYDGLIGLGTCKDTITTDWMKSKLITNRRIGICIGQAKSRQLLSSRIDVGYVTVGVNLQEMFGVDHFGWVQLANNEGFDCAVYTKLSYIIFEGKTHYPPTSALPLVIDTGTKLTRLESWFFDEFSEELDSRAQEKGYTKIAESDMNFEEKDRRGCWTASKDTTTSSLDNFPAITFCMIGMSDSINLNPIQCLVVQPRNYLEWKEDELLLCSNIVNANLEVIDEEDFLMSGLEYAIAKYKTLEGQPIIGGAQMRDYLFEFDPDNYGVRWQPNNCDF